MPLDLPPIPKLWTPQAPAIIRPADVRLLHPDFLPASRDERRAAIRELISERKITPRQAKEALVVRVNPESMIGLTMMARMAMVRSKRPASGPVLGDVNFVGTAQNATDASSYTFPSCDLLTAAADRQIIVFPLASGGSGVSLSSLTVAGTSADIHDSRDSSAGHIAVTSAEVASGSSGDIVVNWSGSVSNCIVFWYSAYGATFYSADQAAGFSGTIAQSVETPASGFSVAAMWCNDGTDRVGTIDSGWTIDGDAYVESNNSLCGHLESSGGITDTVNFTFTSSTGGTLFAYASFTV